MEIVVFFKKKNKDTIKLNFLQYLDTMKILFSKI